MGIATTPSSSAAYPATFDGVDEHDDFAAPLMREIDERHALLGDGGETTRTPRWHWLLLLALTVVIVAIQLDYVAGGGGAYWRYLLPLTIVTSLLTALGLAATPRVAAPTVGIWAAASFAVFSTFSDRVSNCSMPPSSSIAA